MAQVNELHNTLFPSLLKIITSTETTNTVRAYCDLKLSSELTLDWTQLTFFAEQSKSLRLTSLHIYVRFFGGFFEPHMHVTCVGPSRALRYIRSNAVAAAL